MHRLFTRRIVVAAAAVVLPFVAAPAAKSSPVETCKPELGYCIEDSKPGTKRVGVGSGCGYVKEDATGKTAQAYVLPCPGPVIW